MKKLTKKIGIILILAPIAIGVTAFSVEAQRTHQKYNEYKMISATYWIGDVSSDFEEDDEVTIQGLNGEELLVNTLRISYFSSKDNVAERVPYFLIEMQTLASVKTGEVEWYKEKIYITEYSQPNYDVFYGEEALAVEAKRKNGETFVHTFKTGVQKEAVHIINEKEKTEFVIFYVQVK